MPYKIWRNDGRVLIQDGSSSIELWDDEALALGQELWPVKKAGPKRGSKINLSPEEKARRREQIRKVAPLGWAATRAKHRRAAE